MNERISRKLSWLQLICAIMIIGLHTAFPSYFHITDARLLQVNVFARNLYDAAISTFFFLSAYLLFRNAEQRSYLQVLKRRFWSLAVPYVLWNAVFYAHALVRESLTVGQALTPPDVLTVIRKLTIAPANSIFWFLLTLGGLIVLFPVLRWAVRRKWPAWMAAILCAAAVYIPPLGAVYETMVYWLPVYLAGAYTAYWHRDRFERLPQLRRKWMYAAALAAWLALAWIRPLAAWAHYLYWLPAALLLWMLADGLAARRPCPWWAGCSFYLYCCHMVVEHYAVEIYLRTLGTGVIPYLLSHILLPCLCAAIALAGAAVVRKLMPGVFRLFTGMRS